MTINEIIAKYNGKVHNANEWWPNGAIDPREVIVEIPKANAMPQFVYEINAALDLNNPIQEISEDDKSVFYLYYAV